MVAKASTTRPCYIQGFFLQVLAAVGLSNLLQDISLAGIFLQSQVGWDPGQPGPVLDGEVGGSSSNFL